MKSAATILLIVQTFFLSPVLNAQTVRTAPVSMPAVSAPLAVGAAMTSPGIGGSLSLGSQALGPGGLSISPLPALQPSAAAKPAPAAAAVSQVLPSAVSPSVAQAVSPAVAQAVSPQSAPAAMAVSEVSPSAVSPKSAPAAMAVSKASPLAVSPAVAQAVSKAAPSAVSDAVAQAASPALAQSASAALFDGAAKAEPKEWTFMVFLNGHNNLDSFGELNVKQMEKVGSNDRVNIVVQWASLGKPTKRMLIQRSESGVVSSPVIEELPAVDMGSVDQLYEFVRWSVERFPAKRYFLDLWDHGAGWHIKNRGNSFPHDISWDDQTGSHISTEQLGDVARKIKALIGHPLDVLGFDACLMAMAEVAAQVGDSVRYMGASEETEPGAGWPYDKVLKQWLESQDDDGRALLKALVDQYTKAYSRKATFSGVDLAKFPAFVDAAKALGKALAEVDDAKLAEVRKAAGATRRYAFSDYADFMDFVERLSKASGVIVAAPVLEAVVNAYKAMLVANNATADMKGSNGMSVWLPTTSYLWQQYGARYLKLVWNTLSDWGRFVKRLSGAK